MGPPSYMRSVVDRNVVTRRMTVLHHKQLQKMATVRHYLWDFTACQYDV
jgi:hypothetical protein